MISNPQYWLNCGHCGLNITLKPQGSKFFITNCGHIFCQGCVKQCVQPVCFTCKNTCSNVMPMNNQLPSVVLDLLKSPQDEINNLKKAITFHIDHYDRVISQLGKLINHHQMELAKGHQKLQESVVQLKELNDKIPEAQEMIVKLENAVKTLANNKTSRLNRSGGVTSPNTSMGSRGSGGFGRSMGAQNGGMGMAMGCQNRGMGMSLGGQNGGLGMSLGGQNGGKDMSLGGQNRGMGMAIGGQNRGMGMSLGGQNRGLGMSMGGQNGGMPGIGMAMGSSGMAMPMTGQNRGLGMSMGNMGMRNGSGQRPGNRLF